MKVGRLLLIGLVVLVAIGRFMPFTLMVDPGEPQYLWYTSFWNIFGSSLLRPSYLIARSLGLLDRPAVRLLLDFLWVAALSLLIYIVPGSTQREPPGGA